MERPTVSQTTTDPSTGEEPTTCLQRQPVTATCATTCQRRDRRGPPTARQARDRRPGTASSGDGWSCLIVGVAIVVARAAFIVGLWAAGRDTEVPPPGRPDHHGRPDRVQDHHVLGIGDADTTITVID